MFYKVVGFRTDPSASVTALISQKLPKRQQLQTFFAKLFVFLLYFRLLICNHGHEFNKISQEVLAHNFLSPVCCTPIHFSGSIEGFLVSSAIRCPSSVRRLSSLTFHFFDFSSETTEGNLTKPDRKQDLNVLYQVCVFWADRKNKMAALASDWLRHFRILL